MLFIARGACTYGSNWLFSIRNIRVSQTSSFGRLSGKTSLDVTLSLLDTTLLTSGLCGSKFFHFHAVFGKKEIGQHTHFPTWHPRFRKILHPPLVLLSHKETHKIRKSLMQSIWRNFKNQYFFLICLIHLGFPTQ